DGRVRELRRDVQQLCDRAVGRQDRPGRHVRAGLSAATRAADRGDHPVARGGQGRRAACVRDPKRGLVSAAEFDGVPGLVEVTRAHHETTVVVEAAHVVEAATALRDQHGFNFLSDITAVDYLGWATTPVSGYVGTAAGRDLNAPMTQGYQAVPASRPKR